MRVCVLMGGVSEERPISLKSGNAVLQALEQYDDIEAFGFDVQGETEWLEENLPTADIYFIALHGRFGEDGQMQKFLQERGLAYTGSGPDASRTAMDKCLSRKAFAKHNIPIPKGLCLTKQRAAGISLEGLQLPVVVKPADSGSSFGLSIVKDIGQIHDAMEQGFSVSGTIVIEEFIKGKEITVGIIDNRPLTPIEIAPLESECFDYQAKYTKGKTDYIIPARLTPEQQTLAQETALSAFNSIGCEGFGRVDIILNGPGAVVLEINTIPGMTGLSLLPMAAKYEGIEFGELCYEIVMQARRRFAKKKI